MPCSFLYFYQISWIAPSVNFLGVPLATLVLATGVIALLLSLIPFMGLAADLVLAVGGVSADWLLKLAAVFGTNGMGNLPFVSFWCWICSALALLGAWVLYKHRHGLRPAWRRCMALGLAALLVFGLWFPGHFAEKNQLFLLGDETDGSVMFVQGDCAAVVGYARSYTIAQALSMLGIDQIDWLIVPENAPVNTDLKTLLCLVQVKNIMATQSNLEKGILTGLDDLYETENLPKEISLGTMTLTMQQDLNRVVCQADGVCVGYHYGTEEPQSAAEISVIHPMGETDRGFSVIRNGRVGYMDNNAVMIWRKEPPQLHAFTFM